MPDDLEEIMPLPDDPPPKRKVNIAIGASWHELAALAQAAMCGLSTYNGSHGYAAFFALGCLSSLVQMHAKMVTR